MINLGLLLYGNILLMGLAYFYLFRKRKRIGFQLGMNISLIAGGSMAIISGVVLIYQFPFHFVFVTFASTLFGMAVGGLFGGLFDYQTLLSGYANGLMTGMMAPMLGAVAKNSTVFLVLLELFFVASLSLLLISAKRS
ncbi:hypothetical protein [Halalkalibacterium ligniniphilum]|uniref:hypothetical protein n=1 Tax=Halalkalibacterium ligniniphilum TaxID=1134413 RepID=UPI00036A1D20|nr:hypothetical protein [Halalkalibacterium ligniniphilum]